MEEAKRRTKGRTVIGYCKSRSKVEPVVVASTPAPAPVPVVPTTLEPVKTPVLAKKEQALTSTSKSSSTVKDIIGRVIYVILGFSVSLASICIWEAFLR